MPSHFQFPWYVTVIIAPVLAVEWVKEKIKPSPKPDEPKPGDPPRLPRFK